MPGNADFAGRFNAAVAAFVSPFPTFKTGRTECETAPYTDETFTFPNPHMTHDEVFLYFEELLGFTANQVYHN
jgi:hypothetical protein